MSLGAFTVLVGIPVFFVAALVLSKLFEKRRRNTRITQYRALAVHHGLAFSADSQELATTGLHLFSEGIKHTAHSFLWSRGDNTDAQAFEHHCKVQRGNNYVLSSSSVAMATTPVALPTLLLEPTSTAQTMLLLLDLTVKPASDVHTESSAFNRAYSNRTCDVRVAHALLEPRVVEYLLQIRPLAPTIEFVDGRVVVSTTLASVEHQVAVLDIARNLALMIPRAASEFASELPLDTRPHRRGRP
jgi:hypothetical protein